MNRHALKIVSASLSVLSLAAAAVGCGAEAAALPEEPERTGTAVAAVTSTCLTQNADATYVVPDGPLDPAGFWQQMPSGSGYYAYRATCPFFVTDVVMNYTSNCQGPDADPATPCSYIISQGAPYDLPGSALDVPPYKWALTHGPATAADCDEYSVQHDAYLKPAGAATFSSVGTGFVWGTSWSNGTCYLSGTLGTYLLKQPGLDGTSQTYRFLTRVQERNALQQAQNLLTPTPTN
jgi:hypothetical protein